MRHEEPLQSKLVFDGASQSSIYEDALVLFVLAWYDLISISSVNTRWVLPFAREIVQWEITQLVSCLKKCDSLLLLSAADDSYNYCRFKHDIRQEFPNCGPLLGPLKEMMESWFENRNQDAFGQLHGCLVFMTRLNLPGLNDLVVEAREAFLRGEDEIQTQGFTLEEGGIISEWFPVIHSSYHLNEDWYPMHGNGAVADIRPKGRGPSLQEKYLAIGTDPKINYLTKRLGEKSSLPFETCNSQSRVARVIFVPKSIDKLRTICAEPAGLLWYQQGYRRALLDYIRNRSHPLARRVNLEDQSLNRHLAWEGSLDGKYATIDLSSASDSVSRALIAQWFRKTGLLAPIICTRSAFAALPTGEVIELKMVSPSGSALCFPIETIVFCSIVEATIREISGTAQGSKYRAYGDDIIVESVYASAVIQRLVMNGFKVNTSKSFTTVSTHNFRESCGGEYLDGVDVTPIRLSRRFSGFRSLSSFTPSRIVGLVDMCNTCYAKLPSVRRRLLAALNELPKRLRPLFDEDGNRGIYSPAPTNHHLKAKRPAVVVKQHRIVHDYQSWYLDHGTIKQSYDRKFCVDESIRYYEWLRATCRRKEVITPCVVTMFPPTWATWKETSTIPNW